MTKSQLRCQIYVSQVSGGEGQALPPPLFLDQTEARRAENKFWRPLPTPSPPPPFLKAWIRHCKHYIKSCKEQKTVSYGSEKFSKATLICNPFQSSSLSIRAFFYIGCVFFTLLSSFEQLFLKFTKNMVAFNKNGNKFIMSIALYGASYTHRSGALYIDC